MVHKIYYITVGEYPRVNNLISAQVLPILEEGKSKGLDVEYIAIVPILSIMKDVFKGSNALNEFKQKNKTKTTYIKSWLNIAFLPSFIFKDYLLNNLAKKIIKENHLKKEHSIVFHCRSYYAANLGLKIKSILKDSNIKVIFDMRSILSGEFPFAFRYGGKKFYAEGKEWERYLLQHSDVSLLPVKNGISLLEKENGKISSLRYMPIMGFDFDEKFKVEIFEERWENKNISYIGSIGYWHSIDMIEKVLLKFSTISKDINTEIISNTPTSSSFKIRAINHDEIMDYYKTLLATVITGRKSDSYFESLKLRTNFFSTKAAESLSLGIPIIVNEEIEELASFVKEHQCGIIFKFSEDGISFVNCSEKELAEKEYWQELTKNAFIAGKQFRKENLMKQYIDLWEIL